MFHRGTLPSVPPAFTCLSWIEWDLLFTSMFEAGVRMCCAFKPRKRDESNCLLLCLVQQLSDRKQLLDSHRIITFSTTWLTMIWRRVSFQSFDWWGTSWYETHTYKKHFDQNATINEKGTFCDYLSSLHASSQVRRARYWWEKQRFWVMSDEADSRAWWTRSLHLPHYLVC